MLVTDLQPTELFGKTCLTHPSNPFPGASQFQVQRSFYLGLVRFVYRQYQEVLCCINKKNVSKVKWHIGWAWGSHKVLVHDRDLLTMWIPSYLESSLIKIEIGHWIASSVAYSHVWDLAPGFPLGGNFDKETIHSCIHSYQQKTKLKTPTQKQAKKEEMKYERRRNKRRKEKHHISQGDKRLKTGRTISCNSHEAQSNRKMRCWH